MNIGVIGVGRLGICFALLLEKAGYQIFGSDKRADYIDNLNKKQIFTSEPYVNDLLNESTNIKFTTDNIVVIENSEIIYVMVATPSLSNGSYDISAIWEVINDLKKCNNLHNKILVIGCTTNPGDCELIQDALDNLGVKVLYNPEFIAQGSIISDLQKADMVLIGGTDNDALKKFSQLYWDIQTTEPKINTMSLTAAEICKIAVNCFLTTKISYANMVGEVLLKSNLHQDVNKVLTAIGKDTRIGSKYLNFGFGYGGPCLPRDNRAFAHYADKVKVEFNLGSTVDNFNNAHSLFLRDYYISMNTKKLPFYFRSISYKPNTDIMEESQQYKLCVDLLEMGFDVLVEYNNLIPEKYKEFLQETYTNFKFVSRDMLVEHNIETFEVET